MARKQTQPSYRHHKARALAVVTFGGKNHYLGPWQSPESYEKYARLIAEWKRNNGALINATSAVPEQSPLTINELILAYFRHAQVRYVKNGEPTSEIGCLRQALRFVRQLYGTTWAVDFGPKALKDVRQAMISSGRARKSINKDAHRIKRMVRWAVEEELLPASVHDRLRCVRGIGKGQTAARETEKVAPVAIEHVAAVLVHLPPPVAAMVQLQLLTGTRPQEVMALKPCEIEDRGDGIWYYTPKSHKTEHLGRDKVIVLGPQAQTVLKPWLDRDPNGYCFVPAESVAWKLTRQRKGRAAREDLKPPSHLNPRYTRYSYRLAVQRACLKAGIPVWSPRQLRHTRATQIRAAFGSLEAARAVLGHSDTRVTELYASRDVRLAAEVMRKIG
jgi:integrase